MKEQFVKIDLHVHTATGSQCAETHNPFTIPATMETSGLDGILITVHNVMWSSKEKAVLNSRLKHQKIFYGMEINSGTHHFIIVGMDDIQKKSMPEFILTN